MADPLYIQWLLLRAIPRAPQKISVSRLHQVLDEAGIETTIRSVQRNLVTLATLFPIETDDKKPAGWWFAKSADPTVIPGMDPQTALAFRLVEQHTHLLPKASAQALAPHFAMAKKVLAAQKTHGLGSWLDRVRVIPRSHRLLPPDIKAGVDDAVYAAVFAGKALEVRYRARKADESEQPEKALTLHPVGLVFRDSVAYLLATATGYDDVRQYALHRMTSAKVTTTAAKPTAKHFDIDDYIAAGEFGFLLSKKKRKMVAMFHPSAAASVLETPFAKDQKVKTLQSGWVEIEASMPDTAQLQAYLLSFGDKAVIRS